MYYDDSSKLVAHRQMRVPLPKEDKRAMYSKSQPNPSTIRVKDELKEGPFKIKAPALIARLVTLRVNAQFEFGHVC